MENGEQEPPRLVKKIDRPPLTPEQIQLRDDSILARACRWEDANYIRVEDLTDAEKAIRGIVSGKIMTEGYEFSEALEHPSLGSIVLLYENETGSPTSLDEGDRNYKGNPILKPKFFRNSAGWGSFGGRNYIFHLESIHPKHEINHAIEGTNFMNSDIVAGENLVIKKRLVKKTKGRFLFKREIEEEEAYLEKDGRIFVRLEFSSQVKLVEAQEGYIEVIKQKITEVKQALHYDPEHYDSVYKNTTSNLPSLEEDLKNAYKELVNLRVATSFDPKPLFSSEN